MKTIEQSGGNYVFYRQNLKFKYMFYFVCYVWFLTATFPTPPTPMCLCLCVLNFHSVFDYLFLIENLLVLILFVTIGIYLYISKR